MRTWATLKLRLPSPASSLAGLQPAGEKRPTPGSLQPGKGKPSVYHEYQGPSSLLWSDLAPTQWLLVLPSGPRFLTCDKLPHCCHFGCVEDL